MLLYPECSVGKGFFIEGSLSTKCSEHTLLPLDGDQSLFLLVNLLIEYFQAFLSSLFHRWEREQSMDETEGKYKHRD